jgi:hypothetical protein
MAKELNIISEISRMREMMGFNDINYGTKKYIQESMYGRSKNILTEALTVKDDWISRIFKAITGDDNYSERFGKTIADQWDSEARGVADVLEREGLDDIGKLMDNIAIAKGIDVSAVRPDMIDDAMRLYFKNNPDIAEKILKSSADFVSSVLKGKDFITIVGASNKNLADDLTYVFSTPITPADAFVLRNDLGAIATTFKNSGLDLNDPAVKEISDALDNLEKTADMMSDTSGKIPDASPDAAPIPKDALSSGKTKAELDAEAKAKSDEDAANKAKKDQEDAQRQSDENFEKMKNESLDQSIDKLKADENWTKAFSIWSKLFSYIGMGNVANYISRAEKSLGSLQLYTYDDFISSPTWKSFQKELETKATARGKNKGAIAKNIRSVGDIFGSLGDAFSKVPFLGRIGKVVGSIAVAAVALWFIDYLVDFGDMATKLGDWTWSVAPEGIVSDPNENREYCLRQLNGYYEIPEGDRFKLLSIPLGCENADAENFDLYVSKIEYLKGGVGMDADGNKVTKKDRFKVTIGNEVKEFEVGSSSSGSTGTGKTKTENDGKAFINSMNGPGQDLEGLTLTKWDALGNENYSATLSNGQVVNIKWDGSSFVPQ